MTHDSTAGSEYDVWFQPQVDLRTRYCVREEALIRPHNHHSHDPEAWIHMREGRTLAARVAFHMALLRAVLTQSLHSRNTPVAVNMDPCLLCDCGTLAWLANLHAPSVTIEVTEVWHPDVDRGAAAEGIAALRRHGYRISLDDYGKADCDAFLLAELGDVDEVKLDRQFLRTWLPRMVGAVRLIHAVGASVLVEGVETPADHAECLGAGADAAQGYFYGRAAA